MKTRRKVFLSSQEMKKMKDQFPTLWTPDTPRRLVCVIQLLVPPYPVISI